MSVPHMTLLGISNCDTVRKARKWLEKNNISHDFQDVRETPLNATILQGWAAQVGWEVLFNKRSTSYRGLEQSVKDNLNEQSALTLIIEHPTLMKRPVLVNSDQVVAVGFNEKLYQPLTSG
ncbi:arsenate reductase [Echinimonas agarilytica]|uniref:Arsenate reductase n=1 Tax=Echinimonas agarilytica TaxID=1215918 RepID=A0AA41W5M2_9GAMM|nr:arsenate reductase [Echinimonas agarilytica]MCM2679290.1 arsenate reductase [Echinimonas agarilytica]